MPNELPDDRAETSSPAAMPGEPTAVIPSLSAAQRRELRAAAHHLNPVVMIGESGLTRGVLAEIGRALESHQLIKVRVFGDDREERGRMLERICSVLGCAPIQMIGKLLVIWRPAAEKATGTRRPLSKKKAAQAAERPATHSPFGRETIRAPRRSTANQAERGSAGRSARPAQPGTTSSRGARPAKPGTPSARGGQPGTPSSRTARPSASGTRTAAKTEAPQGGSRPRTAGAAPRSQSASGKPGSQSGAGKARSTGASRGPGSTRSTGASRGSSGTQAAGASRGPSGSRSAPASRGRPSSAGRPAARKRGSHS